MNSIQPISKIGALEFQDFRTEFFITSKVKEFIESCGKSLAIVIPDAWFWHEVILFDILDSNPTKLGKNFRVVFYGLITKRDSEGNDFSEEGFQDNFEEQTEPLLVSDLKASNGELIKYKLFQI